MINLIATFRYFSILIVYLTVIDSVVDILDSDIFRDADISMYHV
jgi:hypothetical protein